MVPLVENIIRTLQGQADTDSLNDAMLNAAYLFEKQRGLAPCAWSDEVLATNLSRDDVALLQRAVVAYVEREGVGSWALGKCMDVSLKPVLVAVLKRQLDGDASGLFQAMIALDSLGEPVFGDLRSHSILEESRNRELAAEYLIKYCSGDSPAG